MKLKALIAFLACSVIFYSCNPKIVQMKNSLEETKKIFNQDKDEIIQKYSATGAGIGQENGDYIIVVYTNERSKTSQGNLEWKSIPLKIKYVGNIKAL